MSRSLAVQAVPLMELGSGWIFFPFHLILLGIKCWALLLPGVTRTDYSSFRLPSQYSANVIFVLRAFPVLTALLSLSCLILSQLHKGWRCDEPFCVMSIRNSGILHFQQLAIRSEGDAPAIEGWD